MADFLSQYSIQRWLEMCPQGYLEDTVYGRGADEREPDEILENEDPPNTVHFEGKAYEAESSDAGHFYRNGGESPGGSGQEFITWTYVDESEKLVLVVEQWGENEFAASAGEMVEPYQFSNILPGG